MAGFLHSTDNGPHLFLRFSQGLGPNFRGLGIILLGLGINPEDFTLVTHGAFLRNRTIGYTVMTGCWELTSIFLLGLVSWAIHIVAPSPPNPLEVGNNL